MKKTLEELSNELKRNNIRLTHQRLKVLEYLSNGKDHPTVEQIYNALKKEVPSLSKTTIYNTLNYLSELNLIRVLAIDENEAHFDAVKETHGRAVSYNSYFKAYYCDECGNYQPENNKKFNKRTIKNLVPQKTKIMVCI